MIKQVWVAQCDLCGKMENAMKKKTSNIKTSKPNKKAEAKTINDAAKSENENAIKEEIAPPAVTLVNDDCQSYLAKIPAHSVDLILTDPPYNIAKYSTGNINLPGRSAVNNDLGEWDLKTINPLDFVDEFKRILKPNGNAFIFTSYNLIGKWHEAFDDEFDTFQYFIWHKTNPMPKIYKNGFLNSCEMIVCLWNKGHKWNFTTQNEMHNFFECPICMGKERLKNPKHPSQKPLRLLRHLVKTASDAGDIVLDPFMGVGSTGVAAVELGRSFIGCEIDKKFFDAAKKRIDETTPLKENM